jgi:hypothetical protein
MSHIVWNSENSLNVFASVGLGRLSAICKQILNNLVERANRSVDRGRFAALPLRQLDDIGMTIAERDAQLR